MRALPPGATTRPYNIYEVVNPVEVRAGTVAPWFGQLGLGTQYELPDSVGNLIENGYLKLAEDGG
jgi:Tuberculosis necrotizing toxin